MMDFQQKAAALNALMRINICTRGVDSWYVNQSIEVGEDNSGVLVGEYGNGKTPEEAIEDHWQRLCIDLTPSKYLVLSPMTERRRHVRWNGYMWLDIPIPQCLPK